MVDKKDLFRLALYQSRHALAMARSQHERLQNQQVQRPLQQGNPVIGTLLGSHPTQASHCLGRMSTRAKIFMIDSGLCMYDSTRKAKNILFSEVIRSKVSEAVGLRNPHCVPVLCRVVKQRYGANAA